MRTTFLTNAGALAGHKRILANRTDERFRLQAHSEARKMLFLAQSFSGGTLSAARLAQLGNPYARRLPANSAPTPDYIINRQSGTFARSWRARAQRTRRGWTVTLWNDSPEAQYMLGTDLMRARPIIDEILRRTQPDQTAGVRRILDDARREGAAPVPGVMVSGGAGGAGSRASGGSALGALVYATAVGVTSAVSATQVGIAG